MSTLFGYSDFVDVKNCLFTSIQIGCQYNVVNSTKNFVFEDEFIVPAAKVKHSIYHLNLKTPEKCINMSHF